MRKRLRRIDAAEDAHVREVQVLTELDPNSAAVKAMRERHLRAFTDLEAERDQIGAKLAALAGQASDHGGDPGLLDDLPMLGDVLPRLPDRIKAQLFEAFDLAMLYHKKTTRSPAGPPSPPAPPPPWPPSSPRPASATWPPTSPAKIIFRICHDTLGMAKPMILTPRPSRRRSCA